jgi:hypothetical protein
LEIENVAFYFATAEGKTFDDVTVGLHFTAQGQRVLEGQEAQTEDGIISIRPSKDPNSVPLGNAQNWSRMIGKVPFGEWALVLPNTQAIKEKFANDEIEDILLVITFKGDRPVWPSEL